MPRSPAKPDQTNVPAYQRKRSLSAKARRKSKPRTALERREAGVPVVKPKRTRRSVRSSSVGTLFSSGSSLSDPDYRAKIAARRAALSGSSSSTSSSGGFASLGAAEEKFSAPVVDEYDTPSSFREMVVCGEISGYFEQIDVAVVQVSSRISVGDQLFFETQGGLFEQTLESMQADRKDVEVAYSGDDIGIKVKSEPRKGGQVYKVV
ncbi:hypothetical protein HOE67_01345 [Candidatus Peregrinibacteria bacterium]|jgi:hypothetical protein|nr:hypothetical protein [Candidatus Peregrinibacteria bacterium]MBT4055732.1 hypothetical protein [Candidatus Peregrinibacteria bacterium]